MLPVVILFRYSLNQFTPAKVMVDAFTVDRVDDSASLRASAGISIGWDSPFGPIRFDFAKILLRAHVA